MYIAAMPETFVRRKVTKKGEMQANHAPLTAHTSTCCQDYMYSARKKGTRRSPLVVPEAVYQLVPEARLMQPTHFGELGAVSDCMPMSKTDDQIRISPK